MTNWTDSLASKPWPPMQSFVRRRLSETAGILLFLAALLLTVLLASYDHEDPSWSHAVDAPVQNWIGPYGASVADVLCQTLGGAALILPFVFFAWSFRLLLNRGLTMLWLRLVLLPPSALLAATALAIIPAPHWWGLARVGLGGWFGDRILGLLAGTAHLARPLVAMAAAALVGLSLLYILGLSRRDWRQIGQGAGRVAVASGRGGVAVAGHGARVATRLRTLLRAIAGRKRGTVSPDAAEGAKSERREPLLGGAGDARPLRGNRDRSEEGREASIERQPRRALPPDLVAPKPAGAAPGRRATPVRQATLDLNPDDEHVLPPLDLLAAPPASKHTVAVNEEALQQNARLLETVLDDVGIKTMILSILYRLPPDQCKFIMVDPKMLELSVYDGIPHLLAPVVTDPRKAVMALKWAVREMENRYRNMSKLGVRNIEGYNGRLEEARNKGEILMRRIQTGFNPETRQPGFQGQGPDPPPLPLLITVGHRE